MSETTTKRRWVWKPADGSPRDVALWHDADTRPLVTVHHHRGPHYWWESYDGKDTKLAGEPYMTAERAKADAIFRPQAEKQSVADKLKDVAAAEMSKRPVDDGKKFVPDPEAVAARAQELADQHGEDGPEVSGADAEPPAGPNVDTWETTVESATDAAMTAGLAEGDLNDRIGKHLIVLGKKGKAATTTKEQRLALVAAVANGTLGADGKIGQ